jgi:hypothetical protein
VLLPSTLNQDAPATSAPTPISSLPLSITDGRLRIFVAVWIVSSKVPSLIRRSACGDSNIGCSDICEKILQNQNLASLLSEQETASYRLHLSAEEPGESGDFVLPRQASCLQERKA